MRARDAVLDYQKTNADTATYEKDLDLQDPISALYLEVEALNGSSYNKGNFISDIVPKIEIVDGSEVLASLNMFELEALQFYKTGITPTLFPSEWDGGTNRHGVMLLFGRYLWDQQFALDPAVFRNPQLKVTFNKAAVAAASDTVAYKTGDTIKLTVVAKVMENMGSRPGRYLMPRSVKRWTSTSGENRIELPTDYPYRLMMLRAYVAGSDIDEVITDLKFTCDTDKYIMFNRKVKQLDAEALARFGLVTLKHDIFASDSDVVRLLVNKEPIVSFLHWLTGAAYLHMTHWAWSSQLCPGVFTATGTPYGTDIEMSVVEQGHALHATLPIVFGLMNDESTWFNPKEYGKIEVVPTEAVAATCGILLEQVRPNMKVG